MVYGDLNAPRVGKVVHPRDYRWCSYRYYAYGAADPLITPSPSYRALGMTTADRQRAYREMVDALIEEEGLAKRAYSLTRYIGDPDWVRARYRENCDIANAKRVAYLERQRRAMYATSPP